MSSVLESPVITIDGPSGAGKGTICRMVASAKGFALLDSGALYRLTALAGLNKGVDLADEAVMSAVAASLNVSFDPREDETVIILDGIDVSRNIREERVGMGASQVAAHPGVREALLQRQRDFQQPPGLVADGRDMGTVVFPDAPVKIFLTASAKERATRRKLQLEQSGQTADFDAILAAIEKRDEQDRNRASSPLVPAEDAIELDSTALSITEVFDRVMHYVDERIHHD